MNKFARPLAFAILALAYSGAQANITSFNPYSYTSANQYHSAVGSLYNASMSGPPINFNDSFNVNTVGAFDYTRTAASYVDAVTTLTSTYAQIDASTWGWAQASATLDTDQANVFGYSQANFTLDQAGVVTLSAYGTGFSTEGYAFDNIYLYLDGTYYQTAAGDGNYVIPVAAGSHYGYVEASIVALSGNNNLYGNYSFTSMYSSLQLTVSSVPEPCSLVFLGTAGLVGLLRRKSAKAS